MRLGRLRWPEWLITAGGLLLLAAMLVLSWYSGGRRSLDGWHGLTHLRWVLLAAVVLALATALSQLTRRSPAIPVTLTLCTGLFGIATAALLVYRVLADPPGGTRKAGGFVALAATLAVIYGAFRSLRTDAAPAPDGPVDIPVVPSVPRGDS